MTTEKESNQSSINEDDKDGGELGLVPIFQIHRSPKNDRLYRTIDPNDPEIQLLAESIRINGLLQPLVVTSDGYVVSGHRRLAACKLVGLQAVPVMRVSFSHDDDEFLVRLREYNRQRIKSLDEVLREEIVDVNLDNAHEALLRQRQDSTRINVTTMEIGEKRKRAKISGAKRQFLHAVWDVLHDRRDYLPLSDRQIHYALLNNPPLRHAGKADSVYRNDKESYKDLTGLLTRARLERLIDFQAISDETRPVVKWKVYASHTMFIREQLEGFLGGYVRDYQLSQPCHVEIVGEKNTIMSIVRRVAMEYCIPYTIGRGYCSLRPRYDLVQRFKKSGKDKLVLLMLSDFDPDGQEIAKSFARSIRDDFGIEADAVRVALTVEQIAEMELPPKLKAKSSSANFNKFVNEHGHDVFELEAIAPEKLERILKEHVEAVLDRNFLNLEIEREREDAKQLQAYRLGVLKFIGERESN